MLTAGGSSLLPLRQPASGRRAQSRRVSGRSAWTAPECHPGAAAAFPAVSARRSPFSVSVCPAQSGKQSRTEVIGRDLCQKQQNAHLCAAQQGLSHRQDDKGRSGTDAGWEKPVRFFRCHLTGAHRLGRSVSGRGKAAQESHQQHPGRTGSIHSHQPCHRPKWQGQHIPQRALDEQCRHHKKRYSERQAAGPLQRVNPSRKAWRAASGAANGSAPIRTASIRDTSPEKFVV